MILLNPFTKTNSNSSLVSTAQAASTNNPPSSILTRLTPEPSHSQPSHSTIDTTMRSCIPHFTQLGQPFSSYTTAQPASNSPQQQACSLHNIPYSSWKPPTCPQKCEGVCPHLPQGDYTRVNRNPVQQPPKERVELLSAEMAQREYIQGVNNREVTSGGK